ncbi:MAG: cobalamin-dependent protein, partial [Phycisphaerae bacterium]|nr:cobalamin-dependent protein [Phycisphaerae bacterium]
MRILLIKPYQTIGTWLAAPQLGLLYLTSSLRQRFGTDVDVRILDMKVNKQEPDKLWPVLEEFRPDVVGVSAMNCEGASTRLIAQIVKSFDEKIVTALGGPFAHKRGEELLRDTQFDWTF